MSRNAHILQNGLIRDNSAVFGAESATVLGFFSCCF